MKNFTPTGTTAFEPTSACGALFDPLVLPNGEVIPNRIAKAAMEENLCDANHSPSESLLHLYRTWAEGGAGLIITGNVMIDARALTGPGGVVLETAEHLAQFCEWAQVCRSRGAQAWMQINHPGRQLMADLGQQAIAPSAVAVDIPGLTKLFAKPIELSEAQIVGVIHRFCLTAKLAEQAGFSGVQIHAAHGYLFSQFLSPLTNRRTDRWGGSLTNRARIVLDTIDAVRSSVSPSFCIAVKLNSADFQRGGFASSDALQMVEWLNSRGVDLIEVSGGSYESPAMQGRATDGTTLAREAYFLEFAQKVSAVATMPVMVTGGIRRRVVAQRVVEGGVSMVGMATALSINPDLPRLWKEGQDIEVGAPVVAWKNKALAAVATTSMIRQQLRRLSKGKVNSKLMHPLWALIRSQLSARRMTRHYRRWIAGKDVR